MEQTAVEKKFGKYVMASMITMFLQSAYSMIDGLFVNLGLDFVFMYIFHLGIGGAAGASLCAQLFTTVSCLVILGTKKTDPVFTVHYKERILEKDF